MDKPKLVKSINDLKKLSINGTRFFISLGGILRSNKFVEWQPKKKRFYVMNEIDGTEQELKPKELYTDSNIGKAIKTNRFYVD